MRTIAITGGTGFVGRHLVQRHLEAGDHVRVLSRRKGTGAHVEGFVGDLAVGQIPERFLRHADILYHCAGEVRDEARMHRLHVDGTRALIRAATASVGRWVQLSSVGVYGRPTEETVTESHPQLPVGTYECTKAVSDQIVSASDTAWSIVRPSIIFGNDMPNRSLRSLVAMIDRGFFFFIGMPGASANYIHVANVVDALQLCATNERAVDEIFNLSDNLTIEQFVATIAEALGKNPPRLRLPAAPLRIAAMIPHLPLTHSRIAALTSRTRYPSTKIETLLGYRHRIPLQEGLRAFVRGD